MRPLLSVKEPIDGTISLAQLDGQLSFRLRHLAPQPLQIFLQWLIIGLLSQGQRKPAIGRRKIARGTYAGGIKRAPRTPGPWIGLLCRGPQHSKPRNPVLPRSAPQDLFLPLGDLIKP